MITKKQFARMILLEHAKGRNMSVAEISHGEIFKSSTLAVAMEHLGLLNGALSEYASEREGTTLSCYDSENGEWLHLSTRELLDLLPE